MLTALKSSLTIVANTFCDHYHTWRPGLTNRLPRAEHGKLVLRGEVKIGHVNQVVKMKNEEKTTEV